MKRKKLILCFIGAVLLMTGCGGEASLPVYSNLSEEQVREQFETELIQAGAAETDAQKSMAIVKEYNDSIQNTSLVEEGYASFDMTMPEYDIDAIQDLWMKKNPDFIGYNCRITAFGLMKDLIMVQDMGGRNTEYLFLDEAALDAGELFTAEEREKFETVFSEIKTDASTDTKKQIGVQREYWEKAGVTFDEESKLSLITVYLHSHIDENENSLIAGHAGVLLDTGNEILFFEKISFELPYQLIRFEDRHSPEHYSIQTAARQDYQAFYTEEMNYRELMGYPPAEHLMAVLVACEDEALLEKGMHYLKLYAMRITKNRKVQVIGPAAPAVGKVKDVYRKVLYLKQESYEILIEMKDKMEQYIELNRGFAKMRIQFDFDPMSGF